METGNPYAAPRTGRYLQRCLDVSRWHRGARGSSRDFSTVCSRAPIAIGMMLAMVMSSEDSPALVPMALGYLGALGIWIYQTVKLIQTGQTLGKKWAGVKVVRLDGSLASFGNQFLRGLVFGLLGIISIVFIFRDDHRCLHDLAGETKVIAV